MSRRKRQIEKVFKVFCEGDTEYNYFEYIRKNKKISLAIKPVNMKGGGYSNFLSRIQEDANSNCLAKFIIIDADRALSVQGEDKELKKIIDYCLVQNESKRIPHILILDFPDFEYVACLHIFSYKNQEAQQFIKKELGYSDIDDFKADEKVYKVLTESGKGSIEQLLSKINSKTKIINNEFTYHKSKYEVSVRMKYDLDKLGLRGTNFSDFYDVLANFGVGIDP